MVRQRLLQISVVVLLLAMASARASSLSISIGGRGIHFSASNRPVLCQYDRHIPAFPRIIAPQPRIVIPQPRVVVPRRRVFVHRPVMYQRPLSQPMPQPCVKPGIVTVWITNSNGSQLPVVLTKTPQGYWGPRGEYYTPFPSNRQLKSAYGF